MISKKRFLFFLVLLLLVGGIFYFRYQVYFSRGNYRQEKVFTIISGQGNWEVFQNLEKERLISGKIYFYYYAKSRGLLDKIIPGEYNLSGALFIPEIARLITSQEEEFIKVTFPEGWTTELMAERLEEKGLDGKKFLELAENPENFQKRYSYLGELKNLEGYLFPDTYFFKKDTLPENIVGRLLDTFDQKLNLSLREEITRQKKTVGEIIIMASLLEKEVQKLEDMKIVSGIFWKRIADGKRLESDAPLSYILGDKKDRHNGKDLEIDSPYNTYRYSGLPPGPIGNPGENALQAAVYPESSEYYYFLTANTEEGKKVIYSKTFEEHVANKNKYGF